MASTKVLGTVDQYEDSSKQHGPHCWVCGECNTAYYDATDAQPCPKCGATENQFALPNFRRVSGHSYSPYRGYGNWGESANRILSNRANANFRQGTR